LTPVEHARALGDAIVNYARRDRTELRRAARAHFDKTLAFKVIGRDLRAVYEQMAIAK
jgi:hypothetical protein